MANINLNDEKKKILKYVIESYIEEGIPIGSQLLVDKYKLNISSSKVRYILNEFEEAGLLEKTHTSSGRIPSNLGYNYYVKNLVNKDSNILYEKLKDIFARRRVSIDQTVKEAAKTICETVGITLVTSESNEDATLKSIQLVPLNTAEATVILVTSYGEVTSKTITIDLNLVTMSDLKIAIRIFKERLIDVPILKLKSTAEALTPILADTIKNYESILQSFVTNVFDFQIKNENVIYGKDNIILADDISRQDLSKILHLIETKSIWQTIESEIDEDENIKIAICDDHSTFISKKLETQSKIKEIALVGTSRMDYEKGFSALKALEEFIENKPCKSKDEGDK
ncbi:heat-inducible transcriptional repressor HrcA [Mycoplasmopsis fermentans]|nr:heat-inducible transcriptional repressor HrcA [Mycoplasmopsis fermentans]VEU67514.1 heat inducible transcription repressor HrcA [Mesomycoplasma conjunctivae]ADN68926.1 heat inducible transcriptional repressor protein [Mycoplasmopsis fermentans JER]ADV34349.1 Heat-inducible transcription repressor HrcA [Mycoplasmopsis fermentans M64]RMX35836.1 heat-inducible transcription repressor HrcA [Mycoplasmopsis fermentans MF-I2]VEU60372.1 heat inducible transcription repressor HrcA [Mycoplasmopsis fe